MKETSEKQEVPTAMPGVENEDERETLIQSGQEQSPGNKPETSPEEKVDHEDEEDEFDETESIPKPKRLGRSIRNVAFFVLFLCVLFVGVSWFFGMGWFASAKPNLVNRSSQKNNQNTPQSDDEKLKIALNMVASKEPQPMNAHTDLLTPEIESMPSQTGINDLAANRKPDASLPEQHITQLPDLSEPPQKRSESSGSPEKPSQNSGASDISSLRVKSNTSDIEPLGRSLFFGISTKQSSQSDRIKPDKEKDTINSIGGIQKTVAEPIPFGTLIPVRLIGSVFTLRNIGKDTGGYVRMELTRAIEGKGYKLDAGTLFIGNVRGGEASRAFVTIVGLIDPVSGEFIKCSGDLLGSDGGSGIQGRTQRLTGKWTRLLRGLKETASSVIGSVGSLRGNGTVIISDQIRRGSSSLGDEASEMFLERNNQDSFVSVDAGTSGFIIVTELPGISEREYPNKIESDMEAKAR